MKFFLIATLLVLSQASICEDLDGKYNTYFEWWGDNAPNGKINMSYEGVSQVVSAEKDGKWEVTVSNTWFACQSTDETVSECSKETYTQFVGYCESDHVFVLENWNIYLQDDGSYEWQGFDNNGPIVIKVSKYEPTFCDEIAGDFQIYYEWWGDNSPNGKINISSQGTAKLASNQIDFDEWAITVAPTWLDCQSSQPDVLDCHDYYEETLDGGCNSIQSWWVANGKMEQDADNSNLYSGYITEWNGPTIIVLEKEDDSGEDESQHFCDLPESNCRYVCNVNSPARACLPCELTEDCGGEPGTTYHCWAADFDC